MSKQRPLVSSVPLGLNLTQPLKLTNKRKIPTKILPSRISSLIDERRVFSKQVSKSPSQVSGIIKPFHKHSNSEALFNANKLTFTVSPNEKYLKASSAFSKFISSQPQHQKFLKEVQNSYEEYISYLKEKPPLTRDTTEDPLEAAQNEIRKLKSREKQYKKIIKNLQKDAMPKIQVPEWSPGFHEEFMAQYFEFSESWRRQIDKDHR